MLNLSIAKLRMVSLTNPFQHLDSDPPAGGQNDRFMGSIYDPPTEYCVIIGEILTS